MECVMQLRRRRACVRESGEEYKGGRLHAGTAAGARAHARAEPGLAVRRSLGRSACSQVSLLGDALALTRRSALAAGTAAGRARSAAVRRLLGGALRLDGVVCGVQRVGVEVVAADAHG